MSYLQVASTRLKPVREESMRVLTRQDVRRLLTIDECIGAVEDAFRAHGDGTAVPPGVLGIHTQGGGFHIKAGLLHLSRTYFAAKVNGNFPGNPAQLGLPTIQGVIVLCDGENGQPLAVMDSIEITAQRTAAATAVAARYLARPESRVATICGCGEQGRIQLQAIARVLPLDTAFAYDTKPARASVFAEELSSVIGIHIAPTDNLRAAVKQSDVCVTCTPSKQPFLGPADVSPGIFVAAVGADNPAKSELLPELMAVGKIVVDVLEQSATIGDLHHAIVAGAVSRTHVHAELGEIVAGKKTGRTSKEEIIIFDSTGMALQDVAAAAIVYEKAQREECGLTLDFAA